MKRLSLSDAKACILPFLSGTLLALTLPTPSLCFLAWFGLVPLIVSVRSAATARSAAWSGFAAGFFFHAVAMHWVYTTCRFAGLNPLVGVLALVALASALALNWALTAWLAKRLDAGPWLWAAAWTGVAFLSERFTPRLAIDLLQYTQGRYLGLLQLAGLAGPHALGFLIVGFNAALAEKQDWRRRFHAAAFFALLAAALVYGRARLASAPPLGGGVAVEILQPNIDQYQKWDPEFGGRILEVFKELLDKPRAAAPRLIVWPESSIPYYVENGASLEVAAPWSRRLGAHQIIGAVSRSDGKVFSSGFLIGPDGALRDGYHKRQLVPFGEFVPIPLVDRFIPILTEMGQITPGADDQHLFETPLGTAAVSICYEAMFPRWALRDARRGASVIVNITNDGWYKDTWGPHQHYWANMLRAIETRTTVLRSANTGISGGFDEFGRSLGRLELETRGRLDLVAPAAGPARAPYVRFGDWLGWLCAAVTALGLAAARKR